MTRIGTFDLQPYYRQAVGIDRLFDRITSQIDAASSNSNYPPYDLIRMSDDVYEIHLALAGFQEGEISVNMTDGQLVIQGEQTKERIEGEYIHHGISGRNFVRTFALADYVEVCEASMKDGILSVRLEHKVPDHMKPKTIDINYQS
jgi:molecular chaperone IbpA